MSRFATLKVRSPWFHKNVPFDNRFSLNFVYCLNIAEKINEIELKRILRSFWRYTWGLRILRTTWGLSIIATFIRDGRVEERPRGGPNNVKVDKEMRQCLNEIIDENCLLTLAQTNQELRRRLPAKPFIHGRTVGKALDELLFSVKRVRPLPAERNRPDVIQKWFDYASWFLNNVGSSTTAFS